MIYVILGMHKSGTTLIAQTLHISEINMIADRQNRLSAYEVEDRQLRTSQLGGEIEETARSLFERVATNRINKSIILDSGPDLRGDPTDLDSLYLPRLPVQVGEEQRREIRSIVEVLNSRYVDWGFKDPRTCLTYPAWAQELDQHRLIIIFRSYAEVAMHYGLVGAKLFRLVRLMKVLKAWTTYNQQILDHLEAAKVPSIVMSYEDFMRAPGEFDRLCTFVGRPLSDIRNPALYRSRAAGVGTFTAVELLGRVLMSGQPAHVLSRLRQKKTANGLGVL